MLVSTVKDWDIDHDHANNIDANCESALHLVAWSGGHVGLLPVNNG